VQDAAPAQAKKATLAPNTASKDAAIDPVRRALAPDVGLLDATACDAADPVAVLATKDGTKAVSVVVVALGLYVLRLSRGTLTPDAIELGADGRDDREAVEVA
jgi:hypothetical protein